MANNPGEHDSRGTAPLDWSVIWKKNGRWVRAVLHARIGDVDLADDLFQEMALSISRNPQSWPAQDKVAPWLYRVAIRRIQMFRRHQAVSKKLQLTHEDACGRLESREIEPLEWMTFVEARQQVREALDQLKARDREMLILKHGLQWSYRDIAQHLDVSHDKVIYRVGRARDRLRKILLEKVHLEIFDE